MPEHFYATDDADFERLLSVGFSENETSCLLHMRRHLTEEIEYREMIEEGRRFDFIRWLVEHGRLST